MIDQIHNRGCIHASTQRGVISRKLFLFPTFLITLLLQACGSTTSPEERNAIATAYAESLITRQLFSNDSLNVRRRVDSSLKEHGFGGITGLQTRMDALALESEAYRQMLDSARAYLERVRNATATKRAQK